MTKLTVKQKIIKYAIMAVFVICAVIAYFAYQDYFNIAFCVCVIASAYFLWKSKPFALNTCVCITGTPGSGKTLQGTKCAIKSYKRQAFLYNLNKWSFGIFSLFCPRSLHKPHLYSNIPICIRFKKKKPVFCEVLKKEHLLMEEKLPEYSVVFIDEVGSFCGQWEFDNPFVMTNIQILMRFYRHFVGTERAGLVMTEQSSDFIAKVIRARIGMVIHLVKTERAWKILPVMRSYYMELLTVESSASTLTHDVRKLPYIASLVPYKWMGLRRKIYESRCYRYLYSMKAISQLEAFTSWYTRYLIDVSCDERVRKLYSMNKKAWLDSFLFEMDDKYNTPKA